MGDCGVIVGGCGWLWVIVHHFLGDYGWVIVCGCRFMVGDCASFPGGCRWLWGDCG